MTGTPSQYDAWLALCESRAPIGGVVMLSPLEREDLAKLRGTRRLPPRLFGRRIEIETQTQGEQK